MVKKGAIVSARLCIQHIFCVQTNKHTHKENNKNFMHEEARPSTTEVHKPTESSSDKLQQLQKQAMQRGPKQDYPSRPSTDFSKCKPDTTAAGGKSKKQYPARRCKVCCK